MLNNDNETCAAILSFAWATMLSLHRSCTFKLKSVKYGHNKLFIFLFKIKAVMQQNESSCSEGRVFGSMLMFKSRVDMSE